MCIYTVSGAGPGTRSPQGVSLPNDADNQKKRYIVDDNRQKALAAAHDAELAVLSAGLAAGHRRVDEPDGECFRLFKELSGKDG